MTTRTTGHLQVRGNSSYATQVQYQSRDTTIQVPPGMVTVVSFPVVIDVTLVFRQPTMIVEKLPDGTEASLWTRPSSYYVPPAIFSVNRMTVRLGRLPTASCRPGICFKMLFSFHPANRSPQILPNGKWNCSVDEYSAFQHHLECNLRTECHDGRDESGHCPFSSPACKGLVASRHKCFEFFPDVIKSGAHAHLKAAEHCSSLNGSLAVIKSEQDFSKAFRVFTKAKIFHFNNVAVGLFYGGMTVPNMYRASVLGGDRSVVHHVPRGYVKSKGRIGEKMCVVYRASFRASSCSFLPYVTPLCEFESKDSRSTYIKPTILSLPVTDFDVHTSKQDLVSCPSGWFTHKFLACQPHTVCGTQPPSSCTLSRTDVTEAGGLTAADLQQSSVAAFVCGDSGDGSSGSTSGIRQVSYTLLCDFRKDCPDLSDEAFCLYPACEEFTCFSGQCLQYSNLCDQRSDCLDESDEHFCSAEAYITNNRGTIPFIPSPILVKFDGHSSLHSVQMKPEDSCPHTHYRCPGEYNDCLPVYTRCNDFGDCMDHEDEEGCGQMTCPGFYRCFKSTVCVHADHLCDGWPQCPQRDDEWLCDVTCPAGCVCGGLSFLCLQPFPAHLFPQLRYVDARDTGMSPSMFMNHFYLMYLNLARCSVAIVEPMDLPNLRHLDLSGNLLYNISMDVFVGLKNLYKLILANNTISFILKNKNSFRYQITLKSIDLSHNYLSAFDSKAFSDFPNVEMLNLSFTAVHTVQTDGFRHLAQLVKLYMEGSPLQTFPADMFAPLYYLQVVTAQTYKVCCRKILLHLFEKIKCDAPVDEISSCDDLLQSGAYRGFLWLVSILSVLGNVFCFVARACSQKKSTSGFHVFVTNLSVSDFLMGVYIAVIGVADAQFRGRYLYVDHVWTSSVACKTAGFLSLMSSEVSALIIWLITLDRFIVLRFPFSSLRFGRNSAVLICCLAWSVGFLLALLPLLPAKPSWEFYSQTGICIPLPVTRRDFKGRMYSFSVLIVLNFILFLLIATGQAFIYWSVQKNTMVTESTRVERDMTIARRLISVAVTDFLCWFPIGLCGLMALADIPIPGEINVALAIFVLPLNSALNPFMYTFNMLVEKRRKSDEERLIKWLESNAQVLGEQ